MFELYNWIWDRLIPIKEYSVIYGDSNAGVGLVCCSIVAHVTAGKSLPDSRPIDADTVLFVSDNMDEFYIRKCVANCGGNDDNLVVMDRHNPRIYYLAADSLQLLRKTLTQHRPKLVVIDSWELLMMHNPTEGKFIDTYDDFAVYKAMSKIVDIAREFNCSFLVTAGLDVTVYNGEILYDEYGNRFRSVNGQVYGSAELVYRSRSAFAIVRDCETDSNSRALVQTYYYITEATDSLQFQIQNDAIIWKGHSPITEDTLLIAWEHGKTVRDVFELEREKVGQ